jgi:DNA-binding transcriptional regulator GbsR (MarR family)
VDDRTTGTEPAGRAARPPSPEIRAFLEEMALLHAEDGYPPMAGRITGWLLVCEPELQTAAELCAVLEASAGSISATTRLLVQYGLVERVGVPGQRSVAFRLHPGAGSVAIRRTLAQARRKRALMEKGLRLLEDRPEAARRRLRDHAGFFRFLERELPALGERWERETSE